MRRFKEYLLVLTSVYPVWSQSSPTWRLWTIADGLRESYTTRVAMGSGVFWAKHGDVDTISQLDGYSVKGIPDPGALGTFAAGPDGDLWLFDGRRLKRFHASRWTP